ncbi:MAG: lysylphosphatidylglycerol synthase transmembrane domain-containing protein [Verrucomicrobiota bacterium]
MKSKKILMPLIQTTVTLLLLWWIFHDSAKRQQMVLALQNANAWWLIPGFISFGLVLVTTTWRWSLLLAVQGIHLGWKRTWELVMIGMFFNLFLLGSTGGDVVKIFYTMREVPQKKTAVFLSSVVDRLVGMFAIMLITLTIAICFFSDLGRTMVTRSLLTTVGAVFGGFLVFLVVSLIADHFHLWKKIPHWLPGHRFLIDIATAFSSYARNRGALIGALCYSFLQNIFLFATTIFAAFAFASIPGAPRIVTLIEAIPIVNTISAIPVSLSGIGVREGLFETLLNTIDGTPKSLAVIISLTAFFLTVLWSLLGGLVYLFYRPSAPGHLSISEMTHEVDVMEHLIEDEVERTS